MNNEIINQETIEVKQKSTLTRLGLAASLVMMMAVSAPSLANHKAQSQDNVTNPGQGTGLEMGNGNSSSSDDGGTDGGTDGGCPEGAIC